MPAFIKTPADEHKWNAIKHSVAKQRGKSVENFTDRDWATVNAAWHKSEGNLEKFEEIMKSVFISASSGMPKSQTAVPKVSVPSVKVPRPSTKPKFAEAGDKPSLFLKSEIEEFEHVKHPTLCKLKDFLQKKHRQK